MSKRVLVTGGTGFVGANLVRHLTALGHDVTCVVRAQHKTWRFPEPLAWRPRVVDLLDRAAVDALLAEIEPEWVLHLAAYGAYESQADVTQAVRTNLEATVNLVEASVAARVERFINTGSSSEYGYKNQPPVEDERLDPNSLYAVTKAAATDYVRYVAQRSDFCATTLRLYSVYGPWEEPTRLIPRVILYGCKGMLPALVAPDIARDFIHVDDVMDAYVCVLSAEPMAGRVFNVGTGVQTTLGDVIDVARNVFHIETTPQWGTMARRKWDTSSWVSDPRRLKEEIGWSPRLSFDEGFRRTVDWFTGDEKLIALYEKAGGAPT